MRDKVALVFSVIFVVALGPLAPAYAQNRGVLDFFNRELEPASVTSDTKAPPPEPPEAGQPTGSIGELFGGGLGNTSAGAVNTPPVGTQSPAQSDPIATEQEIRNEAFNQALRGMLPLKPAQIRRLLEEFDRTQESYELPVYPVPKPELTVQTLSLDPGTKPVTIRAARGHVTTLNMLDITGAPWPIEDITWAGNFNVVQSGDLEGGVHFVRITPESDFAYGNMSIKMLGLKTPIIMTIETSRDLVHYRFDAIVPDYGPFAEAPLIEGGLSVTSGDPDLSAVLRGVIPSAAKRMAVSGVDRRTSAYRMNGKMYVRTPLTLLSPSWTSSVASADGMRVYTINPAPVLLLSDKGQMVRAGLSAKEEGTP